MRPQVASWLATRLGASRLKERLHSARVPTWTVTNYLGVVVLWLFLLEVASGALLMLFYQPDPKAAHASLVLITGMPHGSMIRGIHGWSGQLFVAAIGAQAVSMLLLRQFTPPREVVWWTSLGLIVLGVALALSGAILPWSEDARLQALVSSELVGRTPWIGDVLRQLLRGGDEVTGWTLHHAYGLHVAVLPALASVMGTVYLVLLLHVRAPQPNPDLEPSIPLYPDFVVRSAAACVGVFVVVLSLALFAPMAVGTPADLRGATVESAQPPWFLLFLHQLLAAAPAELLGIESPTFIIGALLLIGAAALGLPFLDRRGSRVSLIAGLILLSFWLLLTLHAAS